MIVIVYIYTWPMFSEPRYMHALKCVIYIYKCHTYFFDEGILQPFMKINLFILG